MGIFLRAVRLYIGFDMRTLNVQIKPGPENLKQYSNESLVEANIYVIEIGYQDIIGFAFCVSLYMLCFQLHQFLPSYV